MKRWHLPPVRHLLRYYIAALHAEAKQTMRDALDSSVQIPIAEHGPLAGHTVMVDHGWMLRLTLPRSVKIVQGEPSAPMAIYAHIGSVRGRKPGCEVHDIFLEMLIFKLVASCHPLVSASDLFRNGSWGYELLNLCMAPCWRRRLPPMTDGAEVNTFGNSDVAAVETLETNEWRRYLI